VSANLADLVRDAAGRAPDHVALVHGDREITWSQLEEQVGAFAAGLRRTGLDQGERVALMLGNTPDFVVTYFGVLRAGLVAVPVNVGYTVTEVQWLLADAGVALLVCEASTAPTAREAASDGRPGLAVVGEESYDRLRAPADDADATPAADLEPAGGESLAVLLYTSGTSGRPKGAMLSHRALRANLEQCAALEPQPMSADDVVLLVLPLFHVYALNSALGMVAYTGATAVLADRFDPRETLAEIERTGVTNIPGAPPMYAAWTQQPRAGEILAGVRLMVSGASPLPPVVLEQLSTSVGRPIYEGYGLTEASPVVTSTLATRTVKPGSVGRPVPGVELRLVDAFGDETVEDDPGEIVIRGANLFSGYWPDGSDGPDPDGWFSTGDVAYADEDGDLYLVDRRKELVLVSGFNVYPREVEDVIHEHPAVAEAAVIAVPHPYTGEAVKALVVPKPGARLAPEDITAHCARRLARFKCPTVVQIVPELPHSATGKVAKGRLRAQERRNAAARG
jgi:long-chain acyl-CoA synthetase